jgi:hypothetical protein
VLGRKLGPKKRYCVRGHDRLLPNAVITSGGCRECHREMTRRWRQSQETGKGASGKRPTQATTQDEE